MSDPVLELHEGCVAYGNTNVLKVNEFIIRPSEIVLVHGGNGTGKTSLFRAIIGTGPQFTGQILFLGEPTNGEPPYRRVRRGMRLLPQDRRVFDRLSIGQHQALARHYFRRNSHAGEHSIDSRTDEHHRKEAAVVLSGGESKLMIFRCLFGGQPKLLLLDELFTGLESSAADNAASRVETFLREGGACIFTDHTGFGRQRFPRGPVRQISVSTTPDVLFELNDAGTR